MAPGTAGQASRPVLTALSPAHIAAIAHQRGFSSPDGMIAYEKGRPRRENGRIVINDTPGLSLEEALNERARLHGMPPLGTIIKSEYGLEWQIVDYDFVCTPTTFARYTNDCDYLPAVFPKTCRSVSSTSLPKRIGAPASTSGSSTQCPRLTLSG